MRESVPAAEDSVQYSQPTFTSSNPTMKTPEQFVKFDQS